MNASPRNSLDPAHEPNDVEHRTVILVGACLAALVIASLIGLRTWEVFSLRHSAFRMSGETPEPPTEFTAAAAPLQPDQRAQRERYEAAQQKLLSSYGWVDRDREIVRLPIEQAMRILVARRGGKQP